MIGFIRGDGAAGPMTLTPTDLALGFSAWRVHRGSRVKWRSTAPLASWACTATPPAQPLPVPAISRAVPRPSDSRYGGQGVKADGVAAGQSSRAEATDPASSTACLVSSTPARSDVLAGAAAVPGPARRSALPADSTAPLARLTCTS